VSIDKKSVEIKRNAVHAVCEIPAPNPLKKRPSKYLMNDSSVFFFLNILSPSDGGGKPDSYIIAFHNRIILIIITVVI